MSLETRLEEVIKAVQANTQALLALEALLREQIGRAARMSVPAGTDVPAAATASPSPVPAGTVSNGVAGPVAQAARGPGRPRKDGTPAQPRTAPATGVVPAGSEVGQPPPATTEVSASDAEKIAKRYHEEVRPAILALAVVKGDAVARNMLTKEFGVSGGSQLPRTMACYDRVVERCKALTEA
jgi:hypothetical protein